MERARFACALVGFPKRTQVHLITVELARRKRIVSPSENGILVPQDLKITRFARP
jgi:hypothetical protein